MKLFLSYRRDDTGGRAGRLFDVLVARFGANNIFQDVNSAAPGLDFADRVEDAITRSDAVLVVIGPSWLDSTTPDGHRRIDQPDDFVRHEVTRALGTGLPVVPVLVDGARLPLASELPEELHGLVRRQAVTLRDVSWRQDVDDLVRRLEGRDSDMSGHPRRRAAMVGSVAVVLVALVVAVVLLRNRDEDEATGDGEPTGCPDVDDTWTAVELSADHSATFVDEKGHTLEAEIVGASTRSGEADAPDIGAVMVEVSVANRSEPVAGTIDDDTYLSAGAIESLLLDGVDQGDVTCLSVQGNPEIQPTERAIATVGFATTADPTGLPIRLVMYHDAELTVAD